MPAGLPPGVSGAPSGEAERGGGAESRHDHPGPRPGLHGQVAANTRSALDGKTNARCCEIISAVCAGNRKQYRKLLECIVLIQKNYRAFYWRRKFLLLRWAALTFQKQVRGQRARRACRQLQEERRRRRQEEEEQEERRRRKQEEEEQERERCVCSDCLFPGNQSSSVVWAV